VEGLGHCGSCHTPRGVGFQEKALGDSDGEEYLSGGLIDSNVANDFRGDDVQGLGHWTREQVVEFLRTGRNEDSAAFGGMGVVVGHSTPFTTAMDLNAIAMYPKSISSSDAGNRYSYMQDTGKSLATGDVSRPGAIDYLNSCAACHLSSGKGYKHTFPALAGNPVVPATDPTSLTNIVLNGSSDVATPATPSRFTIARFR
jgi:mono/diheme cytochrome c family protein